MSLESKASVLVLTSPCEPLHRPFLWKGKVYAGHAMWLGTGNHTQRWGYVHWQCISELDFDANVMKLEYCFDRMPYRHGII